MLTAYKIWNFVDPKKLHCICQKLHYPFSQSPTKFSAICHARAAAMLRNYDVSTTTTDITLQFAHKTIQFTSFSSRALRSDSAFCLLSSSSLALSSSSFSCSSAFSSRFSPPTMIFFSICANFCCSAACSDLRQQKSKQSNPKASRPHDPQH